VLRYQLGALEAQCKTITIWPDLSYWLEFREGYTVADNTPQEQAQFRAWLAQRGTGPSDIDRILSTGRAALNRAVKWQEVTVCCTFSER
jgi:hypothetical protein